MGLDLEPLGRARPGHEAEWAQLTNRIYEDDTLSEDEISRRGEISIPPYEDIDAPMVGRDAEADAWAIKVARENGLKETDAEVIENMRGYYASTLMMGRCDGVPAFSNGHAASYVDATSFRGQWLELCRDVLDEDTITAAWQQVFRPEEAIAYGEKLLAMLKTGRPPAPPAPPKKKGFLDKLFPERPAPEPLPIEQQREVVEAAGKWFIFWGRKGHPVWANF
jgi:hypothetical protein